jgi:hypothetical protein
MLSVAVEAVDKGEAREAVPIIGRAEVRARAVAEWAAAVWDLVDSASAPAVAKPSRIKEVYPAMT